MWIKKVVQFLRIRSPKAQSFVELAIVLPIVLLVLLGLVETAFFIARYLDVMDLTREAARSASLRDPKIGDAYVLGTYQCNRSTPYSFYYTAACVLAPPSGSASCTDPKFCGGLNPLVYLDPTIDDVVISVYTVKGHNNVEAAHPAPDGYWAFSDHDSNLTISENWKKDCQGNYYTNPPVDPLVPTSPTVTPHPHYTAASVHAELDADTSPMNKGYVGVEFYYCYKQVLALPFATLFIPDPMRIHAYTLMPLPAAQPTPTNPTHP